MSISATNNIKLGLLFIKENYGGIWLMTLKVILTAIPFFITLGITFSIMSGLSTSSLVMAALINLAALVLPLLAATAMMVAMIRSIVFDEKLDTTIFSKLCDKTVLKVLMTELIISLLFLGVAVIIVGVTALIISSSEIMTLLLLSLPLMIPVFIYLILRLSLIPIGVAVGDIQCASEAFPKTKGQLFNVFKVSILVLLISTALQLMAQVPSLIMGAEGTMMATIGLILVFAALIIIVPLHNLGTIAISHLHKKIR